MIISDDTKIALVVYTAKIENNEVVPTSDPTMIRFCTNVLDIQPVDFSITVEPTSTKVNIKADAPEEFGDRPFCVAMFSESDVAASGLNSLAYSKAAQLEQLVYKYGKTWEEVTPAGTQRYRTRIYVSVRSTTQWLSDVNTAWWIPR